jgi:hypothetical protein
MGPLWFGPLVSQAIYFSDSKASQPASQPASHPINQSLINCQSLSHPLSQLVRQPVIQSIGN